MTKSKEWAINLLGKWRAVEGDRTAIQIVDQTKEAIEHNKDLNQTIEEINQKRSQSTDNHTRNTLLFAQAVLHHLA